MLDRTGIDADAEALRPLALQSKWLGPYKIVKLFDDNPLNVQLQLPPSLSRLLPFFHVGLLRPYKSPTHDFADREVPSQPPPIILPDGTPKYEVEAILDKRTKHKQVNISSSGSTGPTPTILGNLSHTLPTPPTPFKTLKPLILCEPFLQDSFMIMDNAPDYAYITPTPADPAATVESPAVRQTSESPAARQTSESPIISLDAAF
ncbi:hypothetical protein HK104_002033 [Borealophlyctis nickersoniae]|nr:hypothetical protein HK104_002033 [Borealophlyctis nickersoniae]